MEVRIAGAGDVAGIVYVHLRSSAAAYAALPPAVMAVTPETRRLQWADALDSAGSRVWVAADGGTIVGFCHLRFLPSPPHPIPTAEISSLYIDPAWWGRGVGRRLVSVARRAVEEAGCRRLTLQVYEANTRARAVYEALGFRAEPGTVVHARSGLPLLIYGMDLA